MTTTERPAAPGPANEVLVRVDRLAKHYRGRSGRLFGGDATDIQAVNGVSFEIHRGETLGLVGESGCGKSTTGRTLLRLEEPTSGAVWFDGIELSTLDGESMRMIRKRMQVVFQDSADSLNPRMSTGRTIAEPLHIYEMGTDAEIKAKVADLMSLVGLNPEWAKRFPHEFSGGQRQRINIARALAIDPDFIVLDEPISALDVSIQAQVINLLADLQERLGLTYLFIAHDLAMVRHISDRIAVMYLGRIVETADSNALFEEPLHPYTQALISAVPLADPKKERTRIPIVLHGEVPSPGKLPPGCVFHPRCPQAVELCREEVPEFREFTPGRFVACHLVDEFGSHIVERTGL
ncbi:MAG TPA: oligopeptide/dipeptide ABC transporter ATP-binding protein [Acidimicrobiia bacterium]|nr:oligopeptide/dipeptide ABC transporter ATP-binding protein [Acidimicrobiia bacterium]